MERMEQSARLVQTDILVPTLLNKESEKPRLRATLLSNHQVITEMHSAFPFMTSN